MGQEAVCAVHHNGRVSEGKALLETGQLLFRGDFRLAIPLKSITSVEAADGRLTVTWPGGQAAFDLGARATKWADAIGNPRSLMDKLGVKTGQTVALVGVPHDPAFEADLRLRGATIVDGADVGQVDIVFLFVQTAADLSRIRDLEPVMKRSGAAWVVAPKGKGGIRDTEVLAAGRAAGLTDTKVARFSETHTALKFVVPAARR